MPDSRSPLPGAEPRRAETPSAGGLPAPSAGRVPEDEAAWLSDALHAVYRYACRFLNHHEAEDAALEAFSALFQAERAGREVEQRGAYLFGVARRRVADRLRRRARGHVPAALPDGWEGFDRAPLPPDLLADRELAGLVDVALGLLEPGERALVLARYRDGLSTAALAERLTLSEKAVEMRLRRAREHLRARLGAVGRAWTSSDPGSEPDGGEEHA